MRIGGPAQQADTGKRGDTPAPAVTLLLPPQSQQHRGNSQSYLSPTQSLTWNHLEVVQHITDAGCLLQVSAAAWPRLLGLTEGVILRPFCLFFPQFNFYHF